MMFRERTGKSGLGSMLFSAFCASFEAVALDELHPEAPCTCLDSALKFAH